VRRKTVPTRFGRGVRHDPPTQRRRVAEARVELDMGCLWIRGCNCDEQEEVSLPFQTADQAVVSVGGRMKVEVLWRDRWSLGTCMRFNNGNPYREIRIGPCVINVWKKQ
jgi:hypothetical protein